MTITLGFWIIPTIATVLFAIPLLSIFRRSSAENWMGILGEGLEMLFKLFWIVPILLCWLIYFVCVAIWGVW